MARFLPPQPSLDHLKNEAKALQKAHQSKDPAICAVLRRLHRFESATDEQILAAALPLTEAQFALAMEYGFAGWTELREAVLSRLNPPEGYRPEAEADALLLANPRPGTGAGYRFDVVFSMALSHVGVLADPATVAGDSGMAFFLQADSLHHPWGMDRKELDMGWWPLDSWGAMLRLDFLGRVYGVPMRRIGCIEAEYRADAAAHYQKYYQMEVLRSLRAGRPVVAIADGPYVVSGYDGGSPPLLGLLSCDTHSNVHRVKKYPWELITLGEPRSRMERRQADAEALEFGLRLGRDEVNLSQLPGKMSGRRAWELWLSQLGDPELCGPHFYSANVIGHLRQNRAAAVGYLHAMSERHSEPACAALTAAAAGYEAVLDKLKQANASKEAFRSDAGRQPLISVLQEAMMLEATALQRVEEALRCIK